MSIDSPNAATGPARIVRLAVSLLVGALAVAARADEPRPLFDGTSLAGWDVLDDEAKWWKVDDGVIVGGSPTEKVPHNTFIATTETFDDFELVLRMRIRGAEGFVNSGIQIRSIRLPASHEMQGYQVDAGPGWWGKLYDESRRRRVIGEPLDAEALAAAIRPDDWNDVRILAEGPSIRSWINGVPALDYRETDAAIPLDGRIGIQVHGGGKAVVEVKDITIRTLPPPRPR